MMVAVCEDCGNGLPIAWVGWPKRGEGPYAMCQMCTHHSVKNRNATNLGQITEDRPIMEKPKT